MEYQELYQKLSTKRNLGYRRFKRLSKKEKILFTNNDLEIGIKCLALKYNGITKKSLERSLRWAKRHYKRYSNYLVYENHFRRYEYQEVYLEKEFLFRGFVPEDSYKKKPEFNYIISNRKINGKRYIYPKPFGRDISIINQGYQNIYEAINYIGVEGYTKVDIKFTKLPENNGNKKKRRKK